VTQPVARRRLIGGLVGLGAAGVAGVAGAAPAGAADGDPLVLGQSNASGSTTSLNHTASGGPFDFGVELNSGGRAALAIGGDDNPGYGQVRHVIWAEMRSQTFGDSAILATANDAFAIEGRNASTGLPTVAGLNQGTGPGLGGGSSGGGPQLHLETDAGSGGVAGAPVAGTHAIGGIRLDVNGDLWVCIQAGTPGTWARYLREDQTPGRTITVTPFRALGTQAPGGRPPGSPAVPGQVEGPLQGGQFVTLDLAGIGGIPTSAAAVVGNATVKTPSGDGTSRIRPSGGAVPASIIAFSTGTSVANAFTCALGPDGITLYAPISSSITYEVTIDIAAYIT